MIAISTWREDGNLIVGGVGGGDDRPAAAPFAVDVAAGVPRAEAELRQELVLFSEPHRLISSRSREGVRVFFSLEFLGAEERSEVQEDKRETKRDETRGYGSALLWVDFEIRNTEIIKQKKIIIEIWIKDDVKR